MIKRVVLFQTEDGKNHATEQEAKTHDLQNEALSLLQVLLRPAINTGRTDAILKLLVAEEVAVREILAGLHKRLPKQAKQAA